MIQDIFVYRENAMKSPTNARMKADTKEKVDQNARKIKNVCMENVCPNVSQAVEIMTLV